MTIAPELLRRIVEGALLAAGQPLSEDKLLSLIDEGERPEKSELKEVLDQIAASCAERGFELKQVASGWRFQVPEDLAPWVNRLWEEKAQKYSRAILETLAIIAYRQPITRGDIEEIRGVAVSSHIVKTLSERGWIKVVGQRDVPGKPSLYATTKEFLDYFNLRTLDDLPTLAEIRDIDSLNQVLDLDQRGGDALVQGDDAEADFDTDTDTDTEVPVPEAEVASVEDEDAAVAEISLETAVEAPREDEVSLPDDADMDPEAATLVDFSAAESEQGAEIEQLDVAEREAERDGTLFAELPPSGMFADGDDFVESTEVSAEVSTQESTEEAPVGDFAAADDAVSGDADTDGETREEPQAEYTTP
ncbi:SMC-Scp complex subunit ScpB [Microbulbifer magnicolonia]|uniref:SMC-Scp complex subunit ScpB n=1 Tax=Microbulbifer magnicolonia TaxID=3109744 RepID=UPI002B40238B|nr:SMC-Scp complex subunit ScpB [Microbulbifer sp. GG15]